MDEKAYEASEAGSVITNSLFPEAQAFLERLGCEIIRYPRTILITYPKGTTRQELRLRAASNNARYKILLPDGSELREVDQLGGKKKLFLVIHGMQAGIPGSRVLATI